MDFREVIPAEDRLMEQLSGIAGGANSQSAECITGLQCDKGVIDPNKGLDPIVVVIRRPSAK